MSKISVLVSAALVAGGAFAATYTYTGGAGGAPNWNTDWNAVKDTNGVNKDTWSSGAAPSSGNDYAINRSSAVYFNIAQGSGRFKGDSLTITCSGGVTIDSQAKWQRLTVSNLTLNAGSMLTTITAGANENYAYGLWLTGTPQINGTLRVDHKPMVGYKYFGGYLTGNLTGQGTIQLRGDTTSGSTNKNLGPNWRIAGDNSGFSGKFIFQLSEAVNRGEAYATGVEILSADALGGARDSFTPDAVEIKSWNGLVTVDSDITLNAANCGILMQTNSFFEVPAGRVLTVAEPIRLTGGFFKKGAGTLALTGGFTFGSDGTAAADGKNSALAVKEGVLRVTQASDLASLDVSMANGATLELSGTTTASFRSLRTAGVLTMLVDCTGLAAGSTQTITLNMPRSDAEALVGRLDVTVKGAYASIGSDFTLTDAGATVTLKVPPVTTWHNYTGSSGMSRYSTSWNDKMDSDDTSKYLWDNNLAAVETDGYIVAKSDVFFKSPRKFNGGALNVTKSKKLTVEANDNWGVTVENLSVDAGAEFRIQCRYHNTHDGINYPTSIEGGLWRIDGTLKILALGNGGYLCPTVPMTGSGLVYYGGSGWNTKALNQRLESDNSHFRGKFQVNLPKTSEGADMAAGLRIVNAKALGGALSVMTPDALTLNANNGLIAGADISLATENRGILMQTNAYFEVESGKTLTLKEPIRIVKGILKKGSGTLALGDDVTFGKDGASSPNGVNNKLTVQAGTLKAASTNGIAKLAIDFATGTKMEVDAFPTDDGVAAAGFYFAGDTPFTIADAKIQLNIAFPDNYLVDKTANVVLCTVKSENVAAVINKLSVTSTGLARKCTESFWTRDAGSGLTRIGYKFQRGGLGIIFR